MLRAIVALDGWGSESVNQETSWSVGGANDSQLGAELALPAGGASDSLRNSLQQQQTPASSSWKQQASNNGTEHWQMSLRNGVPSASATGTRSPLASYKQPGPLDPVNGAWCSGPTGASHVPQSHIGGTWGEEDDPTDTFDGMWSGGGASQAMTPNHLKHHHLQHPHSHHHQQQQQQPPPHPHPWNSGPPPPLSHTSSGAAHPAHLYQHQLRLQQQQQIPSAAVAPPGVGLANWRQSPHLPADSSQWDAGRLPAPLPAAGVSSVLTDSSWGVQRPAHWQKDAIMSPNGTLLPPAALPAAAAAAAAAAAGVTNCSGGEVAGGVARPLLSAGAASSVTLPPLAKPALDVWMRQQQQQQQQRFQRADLLMASGGGEGGHWHEPPPSTLPPSHQSAHRLPSHLPPPMAGYHPSHQQQHLRHQHHYQQQQQQQSGWMECPTERKQMWPYSQANMAAITGGGGVGGSITQQPPSASHHGLHHLQQQQQRHHHQQQQQLQAAEWMRSPVAAGSVSTDEGVCGVGAGSGGGVSAAAAAAAAAARLGAGWPDDDLTGGWSHGSPLPLTTNNSSSTGRFGVASSLHSREPVFDKSRCYAGTADVKFDDYEPYLLRSMVAGSSGDTGRLLSSSDRMAPTDIQQQQRQQQQHYQQQQQQGHSSGGDWYGSGGTGTGAADGAADYGSVPFAAMQSPMPPPPSSNTHQNSGGGSDSVNAGVLSVLHQRQQQQQQRIATQQQHQLRPLVGQLQLAIQAGHLDPALLQQPLHPATLLLLNQLLNQVQTLDQVLRANPQQQQQQLEVLRLKASINQLQSQIASQQAASNKQQQQQQCGDIGGSTGGGAIGGSTGDLAASMADLCLRESVAGASASAESRGLMPSQWSVTSSDQKFGDGVISAAVTTAAGAGGAHGVFSRAPGTSITSPCLTSTHSLLHSHQLQQQQQQAPSASSSGSSGGGRHVWPSASSVSTPAAAASAAASVTVSALCHTTAGTSQLVTQSRATAADTTVTGGALWRGGAAAAPVAALPRPPPVHTSTTAIAAADGGGGDSVPEFEPGRPWKTKAVADELNNTSSAQLTHCHMSASLIDQHHHQQHQQQRLMMTSQRQLTTQSQGGATAAADHLSQMTSSSAAAAAVTSVTGSCSWSFGTSGAASDWNVGASHSHTSATAVGQDTVVSSAAAAAAAAPSQAGLMSLQQQFRSGGGGGGGGSGSSAFAVWSAGGGAGGGALPHASSSSSSCSSSTLSSLAAALPVPVTPSVGAVGGGGDGAGTSTWLLLKNINCQLDAATIQSLCVRHGAVQSFHMSDSHRVALVKYTQSDSAGKAYSALSGGAVAAGCLSVEPVPDDSTALQLVHWLANNSNNNNSGGSNSNNSGSGGGGHGVHLAGGGGQRPATNADVWSNSSGGDGVWGGDGVASVWRCASTNSNNNNNSSAVVGGASGAASNNNNSSSSNPSNISVADQFLPNGLF